MRIDDYGVNPEFRKLVWDYFWFLRDHMGRVGFTSFVHTRNIF